MLEDEGKSFGEGGGGEFYIGFTSVNIPMGAYRALARVSFSVGTMHRKVYSS